MKWASRGLALLLPAAVLMLSLGSLAHTPFEEKSDERLQMEALLAAQDTRVLVLGNSMAERDIDIPALASALALEPTEVTGLSVPLSRLQVWYAVLRHPVLAQGHRPDLVILACTLEDLIEESGGGDRDRLWEWIRLASENATPGTVLERSRAKGVKLRSALLTQIRDRAVGLVFGGDRDYAETALDLVFGADGVTDLSLYGRVVPVVEETADVCSGIALDTAEGGGGLPGSPPPIHDVPSFVKLAEEHGAQVLFVRLPVSPRSLADQVDPDLERGAMAIFSELGIGYLDLRDDSLGEELFDGPVHLKAEGRTKLTERLGRRISVLGLHRGEAPPPIFVPSGPQRRP